MTIDKIETFLYKLTRKELIQICKSNAFQISFALDKNFERVSKEDMINVITTDFNDKYLTNFFNLYKTEKKELNNGKTYA